jgi:hypothetical protein
LEIVRNVKQATLVRTITGKAHLVISEEGLKEEIPIFVRTVLRFCGKRRVLNFMLIPNKKTHLDPDAIFTQPSGNEAFTVKQFWQWAFSDLQQNNLRGILAEFIIARALDIDLKLRSSWDDYDLITADGIKIEVKCGAYLQNWKQSKHSELVFGGLCGQVWDEINGKRGGEGQYRADVYVFAVQNSLTHDEYDALDLSQWEFYLLHKKELEQRKTKSISLSVVKRVVRPVSFDGIASRVKSIIGNLEG